MRKYAFTEGNFYHIYVHAVSNLVLFRSEFDYRRFLVTLFTANGTKDIPRLDRANDLNLVWDIRDKKIKIGDPLVDIVSFCPMPNHLHFILRERGDGQISVFMHRILVSYAKYLNLKYERRGHVFESTFHSKFIEDNDYLLRVSSYIHLNPKDLKEWRKKEHNYPWSSYQDYVGTNRWGHLLQIELLLSQFDGNRRQYKNFVEETRHEDNADLNLV